MFSHKEAGKYCEKHQRLYKKYRIDLKNPKINFISWDYPFEREAYKNVCWPTLADWQTMSQERQWKLDLTGSGAASLREMHWSDLEKINF